MFAWVCIWIWISDGSERQSRPLIGRRGTNERPIQTNSPHCRRPVHTNWGEREESRGFSDSWSWVKILVQIRGWLWRSSGSSVFSCAQTIMANSSVHLFAMIDLIFGPLVGLREFGTSLLCNRNCSALRSLLFILAQQWSSTLRAIAIPCREQFIVEACRGVLLSFIAYSWASVIVSVSY